MANEKVLLNKTGKKEIKKAVNGLLSKNQKAESKTPVKPLKKNIPPIPIPKKPTPNKQNPIIKSKSLPETETNKSQSTPKTISKETNSNSNKLLTSIPKLDGLLNGGINKGSITCVWAKEGAEGSEDEFIYQISDSLTKNGKVFFIANENSPDKISKDMKNLGFKGNVNFIDATGTGKGKLSINPKNADELIKDLEIITKKIKEPIIVIDSLIDLMISSGKGVELLQNLKNLNTTMILLVKEDESTKESLQKIEDTCDNIIKVNAVKDGIFIREYFFVSKSDGSKSEGRGYPFRVSKSEGIKIYLPKILITGPFGAGKTSFIHSASEKAVSVDRLGTTIALDHGHMKTDGFSVELFGTPGQQRFDPMLKMLGGESFGVVVVVSSIDSQGFNRAVEMMKKAEVFGLPVVVAANKADLRGAVPPDKIKSQMKLKDIDVVPVRAQDLTKVQPGLPCKLKMEDIELVLDAILNKVMK